MKKHYLFLFICTVLFSCSSSKKVRENVDFTEGWKFYLGDDSIAYNAQYDDAKWRILDLPHDWSIEADFSLKNPATPGGGALPGGIGWYRKDFVVDKSDKGKNIYIDFDGIYWNSKVWINGHLLGERPNGYISFRYDLTPYIKVGERNVIAVRVDNSKQPNSRWYSGSGIYRNVRLVTTNALHVDLWGTYVTTPTVTKDNAEIKIETNIKNSSDVSRTFELYSILIDKDGKEIAGINNSESVGIGENISMDQSLKVSNPILWSIDNPYLYKIVTRIEQNGKVVDEYETPLGIRYFSFDPNKGFFLNGESIKIKGVCNHHDLGFLGAAVNTRAIERQLEILKEMGCNGIRTSHNPPAPELLDLCDKMGFIVMDEAFDMWRKKKSPYDYSQYFPEWHERDLTDLILRDRNHPSIFMWSIGNEILEQWSHINADTLDLQQANMVLNFANTLNKKDIDAKELHVNSLLTIKLADIAKKLDPTRPITTGNNETEPSNHIFRSGAMDIIGFNYHKNNWVNFHEKFPNQKLIITESTSGLMSRGYYEMPSDSMNIWPERWDKPFERPVHHCSSYDNCHVPWGSTHEDTWRLVKNYDHISGVYLWTGFDYLGEPTPFWWPSRSSYFGVIDLAGFPKDIYYMYQSEWTNKDVLHIFPHWNWKEGQTVDIWAYFNNADEVELFLNGLSLGKKAKEKDVYHVFWRVPFQKGTLKAVSYKDGKEVLTREVKTTGDPISIKLTADRQTIKADGKDLSFITVEALDAEGNSVPVADNLINFTIEGDGFIAGTDNGDPTDPNSLKRPSRKLFSGKALAVVQSHKKAGKIILKATSSNLKQASIEINSK
ncbi:MAG TPA: glycoside hydrolase family 2 TIM barrel-domain containing protein [Dysgonomonas sp.]|uniref:glycoside hydrolase family 2 TIM barrel-domain containing protein n=1 Tax=unclassified Dysgonomonas TaxID=2630389 RepID=UPI0025C70CF9|nr:MULTISPECIES: glycoside hydrolase family 2 TIM barrel-domain containing protein [unclassified Dysgonomonas]HML64032.1 glycoside hydrolase family 2 TIM barrel-domain containing protein [Dysgonomonas sp.]